MEGKSSPVNRKLYKTRRGGGGGRRSQSKQQSLKIIGNNIAGLSGKKDSLENLIISCRPGIIMLQETKLYKMGSFKYPDYCVFECLRENKGGGGLMTLIHENLNPVHLPIENVSDGNITKNILTVEASMGNCRVRCMNIYGIQESCSLIERIEFFTLLESQIEKNMQSGLMLLIEMDGNAKFGSNIISGDPHVMSPNGELLYNIITRKGLILINSSEKCSGVITRVRNTTLRSEKSAKDFFISCPAFYQYVSKMNIDEERSLVLTRYGKKNGKCITVPSDHNTLLLEVKCPWSNRRKADRTEYFNFQNLECQQKFKQFTNNTNILTNSFVNRDIISGAKLWLKNFKYCIRKNFKKIRQTPPSLTEIQKLIQNKNKGQATNNDICEAIYEANRNKILKQVSELEDGKRQLSNIKFWKLRSQICPKIQKSVPVAKIDENGQLLTNIEELKKLEVRFYQNRLRNRDILPEYESLRIFKENLFEIRLKLSKMRISTNWQSEDIIKAARSLKNKKARDASGFVFELFKEGCAGDDLVNSLIIMMNAIKNECLIPQFIRLTSVTSIFKQKGSILDLNMYRGIFNVSKVRSLADKLIFNDHYYDIEEHMSDSNVGARKKRNIRDNLFVVYSVIKDTLAKKENCEIVMYDIESCFDSQWYQETMNDMWDVGLKDNCFALMAKLNETVDVIVKTAVGDSDKFTLHQIEQQGTCNGPIKCSVQIDSIGRKAYKDKKKLFLYKESVLVPPMSMIDDLISFSKCGVQAIVNNAFINAQIEMKKLKFSPLKCHALHVRVNSNNCPQLKAHSSNIKRESSAVYLGDKIRFDGSNTESVDMRRNNGIGAISQIFALVESESLGPFYFEVLSTLRDSILLSKMIFSTEVWFSVTNDNIKKLEEIDEMFWHKSFEVFRTVSKESLYITTGRLPIRFHILKRRVMYWWHLCQLSEEEIIKKVYRAQCHSTHSTDWVNQLKQDLKYLKITLNDEDLSRMSKCQFKKYLDEKINFAAKLFLDNMKNSHSKSKFLPMFSGKPDAYLYSKSLSKTEKINMFKMKTRMINVAENFKGKKGSDWCKMCSLFYECQEHLRNCSKIREKLKTVINLDFDYCDIQGSLNLQEKFAKSYTLILTTREEILQEMTSNEDQSSGGRPVSFHVATNRENTRSVVTLPV